MRRRLAIILIVLSTTLAVLFAAWWVRSLWYGDLIVLAPRDRDPENPSDHHLLLRTENGLLNPGWTASPPRFPLRSRHDSWRLDPEYSAWRFIKGGNFGRFGFRYAEGFGRNGTPARQAYVPFYAVVALFAFPSVAWLTFRFWRRRRASRAQGRCPHCGYDLRATPERCPECGRASGNELKSEPAHVR